MPTNAHGQIPCRDSDVAEYCTTFLNLIPAERKKLRGSIEAANENYCDPWFTRAEHLIARDLRKSALTIGHFTNKEDLNDLKCYKTLELLYRANFLEEGDKFHVQAEHWAAQYAQELESLPMITDDDANRTIGGTIERRG